MPSNGRRDLGSGWSSACGLSMGAVSGPSRPTQCNSERQLDQNPVGLPVEMQVAVCLAIFHFNQGTSLHSVTDSRTIGKGLGPAADCRRRAVRDACGAMPVKPRPDFVQLDVGVRQAHGPKHNQRFIMPSLPPAIVPLPSPFASLFDARTRCRVQILLTGAFRHTVSTALYCHVLSQAACSQAAWYVKTVPTFSDALACVRHPRWTGIPPFSCPGPPPTCGNAPSRRPRRSWPPSAARPDTRLLSHHPCRLCTKSSSGGEDGMSPVAGGSSVSGAPAARTPDQAGHISVRRGPGSGRLDPPAKVWGGGGNITAGSQLR